MGLKKPKVVIVCDECVAQKMAEYPDGPEKLIVEMEKNFAENSQFWVLTWKNTLSAQQETKPIFENIPSVDGIIPITEYKTNRWVSLSDWAGFVELGGTATRLVNAFKAQPSILISGGTRRSNPIKILEPLSRKLPVGPGFYFKRTVFFDFGLYNRNPKAYVYLLGREMLKVVNVQKQYLMRLRHAPCPEALQTSTPALGCEQQEFIFPS